MKTITASLKPGDISRMIKSLEAYKRKFEKQREDFLRRIAEEGSAEASRVYGAEVSVSAVPTDYGYAIVASGKQVCFLEFGAGTTTDSAHPMAGNFTAQTGIPVQEGSYSREHAQMFIVFGAWEWPPKSNHWMDHVDPQPGLYRAEQKIRDIVERIAREVFK